MDGQYGAAERRALEAAVARGEPLACPACGAALARREVPPRPEVPYVRRRVWLICPSCHRSAAVDVPVR